MFLLHALSRESYISRHEEGSWRAPPVPDEDEDERPDNLDDVDDGALTFRRDSELFGTLAKAACDPPTRLAFRPIDSPAIGRAESRASAESSASPGGRAAPASSDLAALGADLLKSPLLREAADARAAAQCRASPAVRGRAEVSGPFQNWATIRTKTPTPLNAAQVTMDVLENAVGAAAPGNGKAGKRKKRAAPAPAAAPSPAAAPAIGEVAPTGEPAPLRRGARVFSEFDATEPGGQVWFGGTVLEGDRGPDGRCVILWDDAAELSSCRAYLELALPPGVDGAALELSGPNAAARKLLEKYGVTPGRPGAPPPADPDSESPGVGVRKKRKRKQAH